MTLADMYELLFKESLKLAETYRLKIQNSMSDQAYHKLSHAQALIVAARYARATAKARAAGGDA